VKWRIIYTQQAQQDARNVLASGFIQKVVRLIERIEHDPFPSPPSYEKLIGDLAGAYSRRINIQHRLVYQVDEEKRIVKIIRMWTHFAVGVSLSRREAAPIPS